MGKLKGFKVIDFAKEYEERTGEKLKDAQDTPISKEGYLEKCYRELGEEYENGNIK